MNSDKVISISEIKIEPGETLYIEKNDNPNVAQADIVSISKTSIEFASPTFDNGVKANFNAGEKVKASYWTASGHKYTFQAIIQNNRSINGTFNIGLPNKLVLDGTRRWERYKPLSMLISFLYRGNIGKANDIVYTARVSNISAGGVLFSTPKRFNIGDNIAIGFYAGNTFFTALGTVRNITHSKVSMGEFEVAIQIINYSDKDKVFLDQRLNSSLR